MSEVAAPVVAPATNDASVVNADIASGGEGFDRAAALAEYQKITGSDEEVSRLDVSDAPADEPEPEVEKPAAELTEEERLANKRKKLSDDKGKLDQDKLDSAFAKLTAEGRRLRGKVEAFKGEKAAFEAQKAQFNEAIEAAAKRVTAAEQEWNALKKSAETEPLTVLEKLGWSVEKLTKFIMNDGKHTPEELIAKTSSQYEEKLKEQQAKLEQLEKSIRDREVTSKASAYEQKAIATMESLISNYELIKNYDLRGEIAPKVLQNIAHIYREGGKLGEQTYPKGTALDPKTVLDYFEAQEAKALARHGYRPGQAGAANGAAKPGAAKPKAGLSNADTSVRSQKPPVDDDEFDREDALRQVQNLFS